MPRLGPVSRAQLICHLRQLGFEGPFAGGRDEFMDRGDIRLILPNPHRGDVSAELLARLLREARISRDEWGRL